MKDPACEKIDNNLARWGLSSVPWGRHNDLRLHLETQVGLVPQWPAVMVSLTPANSGAGYKTRQYLHGAPKQFIVEAGRASFPHSWEGARPPRSHSQETDLRDFLKFKSQQYFLMKHLFRSMKVAERKSHLCWVPPPQVTEHWEGQVDDISHHYHHHDHQNHHDHHINDDTRDHSPSTQMPEHSVLWHGCESAGRTCRIFSIFSGALASLKTKVRLN